MAARLTQGTHHIGRRARGCYADDGVAGGYPLPYQVAPALLIIVFGMLHSMAKRGVATGNQAYDPPGIGAVGGRQLRGVEHTEASAGARSNVEQTPSLPHAFHNSLREPCDLRQRLLHGIRHAMVLAVDVAQQFGYRLLLQIVIEQSLFRDPSHRPCLIWVTSAP